MIHAFIWSTKMTNVRAENYIDLRGTPCPINYVRCKLALESLELNEVLSVDLDQGEPVSMVLPGLRNAGHHVEIIHEDSASVRILVVCGTR